MNQAVNHWVASLKEISAADSSYRKARRAAALGMSRRISIQLRGVNFLLLA